MLIYILNKMENKNILEELHNKSKDNLFRLFQEKYKISRVQAMILIYIMRNPNCSIMNITKDSNLDRTTITKHVQKLFKSSLIDRKMKPKDKGFKYIYFQKFETDVYQRDIKNYQLSLLEDIDNFFYNYIRK